MSDTVKKALEAARRYYETLRDMSVSARDDYAAREHDNTLAALDAALASGGWRGMESAPKDGTVVLLYGLRDGEIYGQGTAPDVYLADWDGDKWQVRGTEYYAVTVEKPTLWHPVTPPAPEQS